MTILQQISFKVSARVKKKGIFEFFLFRDVQIKLFKSFHLKKKFHKKNSFSAKLLDVEVYYTFIVLITR